MATIQIQDVYDPLRFTTMAQERQIEKNAFIQSGVMVANSELSTLVVSLALLVISTTSNR